jgi:hypothetical protein
MASAPFTALDQDARVARAMRDEFTWTAKGDGIFICETPAGKCYWVGEHACTCPDWQYRVRGGGRCKHQVALGQKLIADGASLCAKGLRMTREEELLQTAPGEEEVNEVRARRARKDKLGGYYALRG